MGDRRWRLGLRLGKPRRRRLDRGHPACRQARHQLDRHRGHLRARPFRGGGRTGAARDPGRGASLRLHQRRDGAGPIAPFRRAAAQPAAGVDPEGGRSFPSPARRRAHRSLPVPLAGRAGNPGGRVVGRDVALDPGGQGARRRGLELRRGFARSRRACSPCRFAAATLLVDPSPGGRGRHSLERGERHGGHRLQPDAIRNPHRHLQPRASRGDGGRRLASTQS